MTSKRGRKGERAQNTTARGKQTPGNATKRPGELHVKPSTRPEPSPPPLSQHSWALVNFLNQPVATATATAIALVGFVLSLAPFIGSSTVLALVGIPMLMWGTLRSTLKVRSRAFRTLGTALTTVAGVSLILVAIRPLIEPEPVRFFYDGSLLVSTEGEAQESAGYPLLTDDPQEGREVDRVFDPGDLTVSCWVHGQFNGDDLEWAQIIDGQYQTLWVPLADLGAMGRGAVRTVLPCFDWRWRLSRFP